ncbi:MAG TPA: hypothetical protein VEK38_00945 [Candidatus Bathyarchaeia archaeon]|nr:hypothetical protein [Candidatus Bathyarchaeia archaeon]
MKKRTVFFLFFTCPLFALYSIKPPATYDAAFFHPHGQNTDSASLQPIFKAIITGSTCGACCAWINTILFSDRYIYPVLVCISWLCEREIRTHIMKKTDTKKQPACYFTAQLFSWIAYCIFVGQTKENYKNILAFICSLLNYCTVPFDKLRANG